MKAQQASQHFGERPRSAPGIRSHARVAIRPDIRARFQKILAKVDAAIAAGTTAPQGARSVLGVTAADTAGRRVPPKPAADAVAMRPEREEEY